VLLSLNTGARRGELYRLQWEDIDLDRKSLALVMRGKRKSHTRHIPLNKEAYNTLLAWQSTQPGSEKSVFPSKNGDKLDNTQTSWENLKKSAKINNFRWHDMRHHFASRLVMKGVPLNTVRELLGHTSLEMTLRYAHLAPEQKERAVAMLDAL
jgi:integrase